MSTPTVKDWAQRSGAMDAILGRGKGANDTKKGRGAPHVVEEVVASEGQFKTPSVIREHHFASKKEAMEHGKKLRAEGKDVAVHETSSPHRLGKTPGVKVERSGGGDDIARDEQGRFAPK